MHEERYPIVTWQAMNNAVYLFAVIAVLGDIIIVFTRLIYMKEIVGVVDKSLITHLLTIVVYKNITHYGIYPTFEIGIRGIINKILEKGLMP